VTLVEAYLAGLRVHEVDRDVASALSLDPPARCLFEANAATAAAVLSLDVRAPRATHPAVPPERSCVPLLRAFLPRPSGPASAGALTGRIAHLLVAEHDELPGGLGASVMIVLNPFRRSPSRHPIAPRLSNWVTVIEYLRPLFGVSAANAVLAAQETNRHARPNPAALALTVPPRSGALRCFIE